ncbi:ferredoxin-NADPH reductase [Isoptericola croceus]|uniref:ferredoxin-NADPH reductase n=1 Tax=Isoptericola croceus TaxID=3031406 RepID=UPI0023F6A752|nr:ferredoxin-NADPH reductase [Isoptericola croceus]
MSARADGAPRKGVSSETYESIFGLVYVGLATNLMLVVACLPVLVLLMTTDPATSWPALALLAPLVAPALVAAFAVFSAFSTGGSTTAVRTYGRAYARHLRRSLAIGALTSAAVVVLVVDVVAVWGARLGAVAIPVFVTLLVLAVATSVVALVAVPELPGTRLRDLLRVSLFLAVRRWYFSAAALAVLGLLAGVVVARPAIGLGVAAAPLLFAVWGGHRHALRSVVPDGAARRMPDATAS